MHQPEQILPETISSSTRINFPRRDFWLANIGLTKKKLCEPKVGAGHIYPKIENFLNKINFFLERMQTLSADIVVTCSYKR